MPDELLRPTIAAGVDLKVRPWRLMSQTYVAFFGGVIASTVITFLNARRLGVDAAKRRLILFTGAVGLVAVIAVFALLNADDDVTSGFRVAVRVVAVLCCLVQLRIQRRLDRAFQLRGADYASLWGPGVAVAIGGAIAEAFILVIVAGAL
jgi:hypothetical protein